MFGKTLIMSKRGSGMVMGFFAITILFALGVSFLSVTATSVIAAKRDVLRARALACAEAGVDKAVSFIMSGGPNGETNGSWRTTHGSGDPDNHNFDDWYVDNSSLGEGESFRICCRDGSGITDGKIVVTSVGEVTQAGTTVRRAIKVVLDCRKENVNVWSNAIFGGVGQAGKSINGNVKIRGSVHLLGDGETYTDLDGDGHWDSREWFFDRNWNGQYDLGEPYSDADGDGHWSDTEPFCDANGNGTRDPALTVTDLAEEISGNADMANNYAGMSAGLRNLLPPPPTVTYGGEDVESLSAKLRVKHGRVNISGSAVVGYANRPYDALGLKETMDGVYVSDGFGGNAGAGAVHSDNGYSNGYDLGDNVVTMPLVTFDSYSKNGVTYTNYMDYLSKNGTVYAGDLTLRRGTPVVINGPKGSLTMDANGNMSITGIVYVSGNINFARDGQINYSGTGSLVTPNNVYVHCNVLPRNKFVTNDTLGLISARRIELATGGGDAQLSMALAMYAQQQIISNKQNEVAGTMVTSYFQMSNVPKLYQVPNLAKALPPGMPGADPIYIATISTVSWEEISATGFGGNTGATGG